jgi:hypothetical protein
MLLMLILPLQTFASAGMLGCASVHPAALERMQAVDAVMTACHEQKQQDAPATQHSCTHCAVCALASVLPVPAITTPALISDADRFTSQLAASFNGFIPDGPERPPRSSFA